MPDAALIVSGPNLPAGVVSAAVSTASAAAISTTVLARTCLVHDDIPAFKIFAVELCYRALRFFFRRHFDESKTPGPAGVPVLDDLCRFHCSRT